MNRTEAKHRLLEAWRERESVSAGHTLSHVELARTLGVSSWTLLRQLHRDRDVSEGTLIRVRKASPDLSELVDSILLDDEEYADEWESGIDAIFPRVTA